MPVAQHLPRLEALLAGLAALLVISSGAAASPIEVKSAAVHASWMAHRDVAGASAEALVTTGLPERAQLESFTDGFVQGAFQANRVAGLTVAVVKDGALFFSKGYGYADLQRRIAVDPGKTLFRVGSISKLFTATAAMQLVERGRLDLDKDVNAYLRQFQIPDTFVQPVTLRHLLTHTAGFEQSGGTALFVDDAQKLVPLASSLREHFPARVWAPGSPTSGLSASYSNWGMSLVGLIAENVSGESFDEYVEREILSPLAMSASSFHEPLPAALAANLSKGYRSEGGVLVQQPFTFIHNFAPAGSLSTTAHDMANFMIAHLQEGRFQTQRILQPASVHLMQSRVFSPNPYVNGAGLGFYETFLNGHRLEGHGGAEICFLSQMALLPEYHTGIFIAVNTGDLGAGKLPWQYVEALMKQYFAAKLPVVHSLPNFMANAAEYAGTYRHTRQSFTTNETAITAMRGEIEVAPSSRGTLRVLWPGEQAEYAEISSSVFRRVDKDEVIAFTRDADGAVTGIVGPSPAIAYVKLHWYQTWHTWMIAIILSGLTLLSAVISAVWHWKSDGAGPALARYARRSLAALGLAQLVFLIVIWQLFSRDFRELVFNFRTPLFDAVLLLPLLACGLVLACAGLAVVIYRRRYWSIVGLMHHFSGLLATVVILWLLSRWNLIGYNFG